MEKDNIDLDEIVRMNYDANVALIKGLANARYGEQIKKIKKGKIKFYGMPASIVLLTTAVSGVAYFMPSVVSSGFLALSVGATIASFTAARDGLKEANEKIKELQKQYDEYIEEHMPEKPTEEELKEYSKVKVKKGFVLINNGKRTL